MTTPSACFGIRGYFRGAPRAGENFELRSFRACSSVYAATRPINRCEKIVSKASSRNVEVNDPLDNFPLEVRCRSIDGDVRIPARVECAYSIKILEPLA